MNDDSFRKWAERIRELSAKQRQDVQARLKLFNVNGYVEDDDWLYKGLQLVLKTHGLATPMLRNSKGYKSYANIAAQLRADLEELITPPITTSDRQQLGFIAGNALINFSKYQIGRKSSDKRTEGLSANTILLNSVHLIRAIDNSWPGYRKAGLLEVVIRGFEKGVASKSKRPLY